MKFEITEADRIDKALAKHLPESRRALAHLFDDGAGVRVNGKRVKKGHRVSPGDVVEVEHEKRSFAPLPDPDAATRLSVIALRPDLVIISKPAGMPTQPLEAGELGTVANGAAQRWPETANVATEAGGDARDGGIVHRLDIGTSGCLVIARNAATYRALRDAFSAGAVDKSYLALTESRPVSRACDAPLVQRGKRVVVDEVEGQPAETAFTVVEDRGPFTLVRCVARTGRMHQVRAHLAHVAAPIVGDTLYGAQAYDTGLLPPSASKASLDNAFFLHAETIAFTLNDERISADALLPSHWPR